MYDIFIKVLNMSYQAGIVICFIILARFLLKIIKAPKKYAYYLWGIAFIRMICPISFETVLSLLPKKTKPISATILYEQIPQVHTGSNMIDYTVNSVLPAASPMASVNPIQIWILIAQIIWLVGLVLLLIYSAVSYIKLKYRLVGSVNIQDNIYLVDHLETPFILGIIRPRIYMPSNLKQIEMEYILQHERAHLKRRDHIMKVIAFLAASIHWFNPFAWVAFVFGCKDMEMSCDEYVMKTSNQDIRKEYSASLLSLCVGNRKLSGTPLAFGEGSTKGRIKNVLHYKKPAGIAVILSLFIVAILAICLLSNPESNVKRNNRDLKKAMLNITQEQVDFNEVVPFEWTAVYTFDPYLPVENQEEIIGIESDELQESVSEGMVHLVFVNNDEVVSCICAYPDGLGYSVNLRGEGIDYTKLNINYRKIAYSEDAIFSVKISEDIVCLDYKESRNQTESSASDNGKGYENGTFKGATDLEEAISQAILTENKNESSRYDIVVESHTTLKTETKDNSVTVYAMVLVQQYTYTKNSITEEGGSHMPASLTFAVNEDGSYTLREYWRPMDGSYYASSIADKFPSDIYEDALDTQKYIYEQIRACYKQVIEYGNINTDVIIENLINKICSSPATASSPQDYIKEHEIEYRELLYLGEYTLDYCSAFFEVGGQDGLEGQVMNIVCEDIRGNH